MELTFERGSYKKPKGHALAFFRDSLQQSSVFATYIVVLPLSVDFSKYVPPFLVSHLGNAPLKEMSAFSLPPVPEAVESYDYLMALAESRDDDVIYVGTTTSENLPAMMQEVEDAMQRYAALWSDYTQELGNTPKTDGTETFFEVNEVMYSMLSERDKLNELSKLISQLRFAIEGKDAEMTKDSRDKIQILSRFLPADYSLDNLVEAAIDVSDKGTRLAGLYLDRCYKLSEGNHNMVGDLDQKIRALENLG